MTNCWHADVFFITSYHISLNGKVILDFAAACGEDAMQTAGLNNNQLSSMLTSIIDKAAINGDLSKLGIELARMILPPKYLVPIQLALENHMDHSIVTGDQDEQESGLKKMGDKYYLGSQSVNQEDIVQILKGTKLRIKTGSAKIRNTDVPLHKLYNMCLKNGGFSDDKLQSVCKELGLAGKKDDQKAVKRAYEKYLHPNILPMSETKQLPLYQETIDHAAVDPVNHALVAPIHEDVAAPIHHVAAAPFPHDAPAPQQTTLTQPMSETCSHNLQLATTEDFFFQSVVPASWLPYLERQFKSQMFEAFS